MLSRELACRCDEVVAWDLHPEAVVECARRCADLPNVRVAVGAVPDRWPDGEFDLVVLSEVAYYLDVAALRALVGHVHRSLAAGGVVAAVHWLGRTDYPLSGAETQRLLAGGLAMRAVVHHTDEAFVLDVWSGGRA